MLAGYRLADLVTSARKQSRQTHSEKFIILDDENSHAGPYDLCSGRVRLSRASNTAFEPPKANELDTIADNSTP